MKDLSENVISNSQFFISYVIVTGGMQIFVRFSQIHNLMLHWFMQKITTEEAMSQRRLDAFKNHIKAFHLDEFIPLFVFIFMVGALYGALAPLAGLFVAAFFILAYKVFKYMNLFVYGKRYEGGGFLFYTLSNIIFFVVYMIVVIIAAFFSLHGSGVLAGVFCLLLFITYYVQRDIHRTFVVPSRTLSLSKARAFDADRRDRQSGREQNMAELRRLQKRVEELKKWRSSSEDGKATAVVAEEEEAEDDRENSVIRYLHHDNFAAELDRNNTQSVGLSDSERSSHSTRRQVALGSATDSELGLDEEEHRRRLMNRFQPRYQEDAVSDLSTSESNGPGSDFFIYRQPSLNRATWELAPRPYRKKILRDAETEIWR